MFWALLATAVVGAAVSIAGRVIENKVEKEKLETEEDLLRRQKELYQEEALFAEKQAEEGAEMQRERAELTQRETARATSMMLDQATAGLSTQRAGTAAAGFEEGRSFEAVRQRFEKGFATELESVLEKGQVQSSQLLRQAALTEEAGSLQASKLRYNAYAAEKQMDLIDVQQKWLPWQTGLGIAGDITNAGFTVATGGLDLASMGMLPWQNG